MKTKKWARKARTIVVHLEGPNGVDLRGVHTMEIVDARGKLLRKRTMIYGNASPALSAIMTDVQARLARNGLFVVADSYRFSKNGRTLRARVGLRKADPDQ